MSKRNNNKGSAIVAAVIIVLVIIILMGASLTISKYYQQKTLDDHCRRQAYLNAVAIADSFANEMQNENGKDLIPDYNSFTNKGIPINISGIKVGNIGGESTAEIKYVPLESDPTKDDSSNLILTVNSVYNKRVYNLSLKLTQVNNRWYKAEYLDGNGGTN